MNGFPTTLLLTIIALAAVLVTAWLVLRGLASMGVARDRNGRLKVVENIPVGTKERIVLVELDSKEYLIGVSSGGFIQLDKNLATGSGTDTNQ